MIERAVYGYRCVIRQTSTMHPRVYLVCETQTEPPWYGTTECISRCKVNSHAVYNLSPKVCLRLLHSNKGKANVEENREVGNKDYIIGRTNLLIYVTNMENRLTQ